MAAAFGGDFGEVAMTDYLGRSARLMGEWVRVSTHFNALRGKVMCSDPYIALVLTDTRPRYKLKADLFSGNGRCGNVYFAQSFADLLLSLTLLPETQGCQRCVYNGLAQHFAYVGSEGYFLAPRHQQSVREMQMMVIKADESRVILSRAME